MRCSSGKLSSLLFLREMAEPLKKHGRQAQKSGLMSSDEALRLGNAAFVDERFQEALQHYSLACEVCLLLLPIALFAIPFQITSIFYFPPL